jgi:pimeloyl-ACP methyl ester carboxylesterase
VEKFWQRVPGPRSVREVPTRFGLTRVTTVGSGPPLVLVHGAMASAAHAVGEIVPLLAYRTVVAVDVIGQSPCSADARLPVRDEAVASWLLETLDPLDLPRCDLVGVSWGGFIASRAASAAPSRFRSLTLVVPAGFVGGSVPAGLWQVARPMLLWRRLPNLRTRAGPRSRGGRGRRWWWRRTGT